MINISRRVKSYGKLMQICRQCSIKRKYSSEGIYVSEEVKAAFADGSPIVALETAVLTHGLPSPINVETSLECENIIRSEGTIPATIGLIKGKIIVGLSHSEIEQLGDKDRECFKVSRRDFPYVLAKKCNGGTTVSGTMLVAHKVGISTFVTGGIGGVHRGGASSMDISADLVELGRTPVTVICAGIKSILDVGKTLEYLETQGVCIGVIGSTKQFPGFFTKTSGFEAPYNLHEMEAAKMMYEKEKLGLKSGMLLAVPIPTRYEADGQLIQEAIDLALIEAATSASGRDITPFVLKRVAELSGNKSLISNIALLKNNAKVGASIAKEYSILKDEKRAFGSMKTEVSSRKRPVVVGGIVVDTMIKITDPDIEFTGRTHRGKATQSCGGVGRNVAEALAKLDCDPKFISAVGDDTLAHYVWRKHSAMDNTGIFISKSAPTPKCIEILNNRGDVLLGIGDMDGHKEITSQWVAKHEHYIQQAPLVVLDGNLTLDAIQTTLELAQKYQIPVWYEPTDKTKAFRPWLLKPPMHPTFASPNLIELLSMLQHVSQDNDLAIPSSMTEDGLKLLIQLSEKYFGEMRALMITMAENGFMMVCSARDDTKSPFLENNFKIKDGGAKGIFFRNENKEPLVSAAGGGDCLASGFMSAMLHKKNLIQCASFGLECAKSSMRVVEVIPPSMPSITGKEKLSAYTIITP